MRLYWTPKLWVEFRLLNQKYFRLSFPEACITKEFHFSVLVLGVCNLLCNGVINTDIVLKHYIYKILTLKTVIKQVNQTNHPGESNWVIQPAKLWYFINCQNFDNKNLKWPGWAALLMSPLRQSIEFAKQSTLHSGYLSSLSQINGYRIMTHLHLLTDFCHWDLFCFPTDVCTMHAYNVMLEKYA